MLIVLRGNSGSGKSTIARMLQARLTSPTAILQQDHFRRIVYREPEQRGMAHAELLETAARHCLARDQHVIMEGIFNARRYSDMLERVAAYAHHATFFAFDLSYEETVRRHAMRPQAAEFTADQMRAWYHGWQPLSFTDEHRIDVSLSPEQIVDRVLESIESHGDGVRDG
ncbi:AAA family ATPase [Allobranchiibius sp. GilTou73]|uniref:AAA family ATPase n=1 Tax=Allobranchiibius sp. GilTou73 TaxID=2904523 RepID=UPI001F1FA729|nr:AAA family ATPase [Allobranchiibius sp. GilTou73]UIJ34084.1 AAA family ATPase [Allobranchiibius sp. GilTou73]